MNQKKQVFSGLIVIFFASVALFSQEAARPPSGYIGTAPVRETLFDSWLSTELSPLLAMRARETEDRYGRVFRVHQERDTKTGCLAVRIQAQDSAGVQGLWELLRRFSDGSPREIRIYPLNNPDIWISLVSADDRPESGRSLLNLMVYGSPVVSGIPVGVPLVRLYTMPLSDIMFMTRSVVPWALLHPDPDDYEAVRSAVDSIRSRLDTLVYLDDGAFDHEGNPVYIRDGSPQDPAAVLMALEPGQQVASIAGGVNCSGFAKWIVDGIIRPVAGSRLFIEPLKKQTDSPETHFTEPFRESRDVFFALDWTRQLASAVVSLSGKRTVLPAQSGVDVTAEPFPQLVQYVPGVGYRSDALEPLLYWLAVQEPGHMYLGAISRERGTPLLRQFHHIAVFLPYFTPEGHFSVAVFESAVETPLSLFASRNSDAYIHLVRIRVPEKGRFNP